MVMWRLIEAVSGRDSNTQMEAAQVLRDESLAGWKRCWGTNFECTISLTSSGCGRCCQKQNSKKPLMKKISARHNLWEICVGYSGPMGLPCFHISRDLSQSTIMWLLWMWSTLSLRACNEAFSICHGWNYCCQVDKIINLEMFSFAVLHQSHLWTIEWNKRAFIIIWWHGADTELLFLKTFFPRQR